MKRFLIFIILLGAGLGFGGKLYYEHQITQSVDELARSLQVIGEFSYHNVVVTPSGEARINQIRFRPHGYTEELLIERLALRTGNLLGLYQLERELEQQKVPEKLGISTIGLRMLTGGELYRSAESANTQGSFAAAGCGDRRAFSGHDLMDMGYNELVMDIELDYELINQGQKIQLNAHTFTRNIARLDFDMELQLGAGSRARNAIAAGFSKAELKNIHFSYQDLGYTSEVIKFCGAETGLRKEEYIAHHFAAWQDHWKKIGLIAGPNLEAAYQAFLEYPDEFAIQLQPSSKFLLKNLFDTPPSILIYQLHGKMNVNRKAAGVLDFVALTDEEQQTFFSREIEQPKLAQPVEPAAAPVVAAPKPSVLEVENLGQHLDQMVRIKLHNGKSYRGRIRAAGGDRIQLQRFESGGHMMMPILLRDIATVRATQ